MKFQLILDSSAEESTVVTAKAESSLVRAIRELVLGKESEERLTVEDGLDLRRLSYSEIECITVDQRKVYAIASDGKHYRTRRSLSELEAILPSYFIRINKSAIANERRILRFAATFRGGIDAHFACGYREYISRRCYAEIKRRSSQA